MKTTGAEHFHNRGQAESAASAFPPLLIAARRIADAIIHGEHGRRHAGPGDEFWQFRAYSPGDAAQHIDWRRSARGDRLLVRQNEWAATNTLWTWVSRSPGMDYRSNLSNTSKYDRACLIALALSVLAIRAGERVAALGSPHAPGHTGTTLDHLARWYAAPLKEPQDHRLPRFATCLFVSDFLEPVSELRQRLRSYAAGGVTGHMVQVLDPAEETFPFTGRTQFVEMDGADKLLAGKAETLRTAYIKKLEDHRAALRELARSLGWTFTLHHTDKPPHTVLLALYQLIAGEAPALQFAQPG
ncbi:MAG TPA: DUF58 domain-containing protein [Rhizobiales bacterium]|nr:DUF58 domain-containing protein [Hyphomicrobiales bacterium]